MPSRVIQQVRITLNCRKKEPRRFFGDYAICRKFWCYGEELLSLLDPSLKKVFFNRRIQTCVGPYLFILIPLKLWCWFYILLRNFRNFTIHICMPLPVVLEFRYRTIAESWQRQSLFYYIHIFIKAVYTANEIIRKPTFSYFNFIWFQTFMYFYSLFLS